MTVPIIVAWLLILAVLVIAVSLVVLATVAVRWNHRQELHDELERRTLDYELEER